MDGVKEILSLVDSTYGVLLMVIAVLTRFEMATKPSLRRIEDGAGQARAVAEPTFVDGVDSQVGIQIAEGLIENPGGRQYQQSKKFREEYGGKIDQSLDKKFKKVAERYDKLPDDGVLALALVEAFGWRKIQQRAAVFGMPVMKYLAQAVAHTHELHPGNGEPS